MMKTSKKANSYFLNKYGTKNVNILENVLNNSLNQALSFNDFHEVIKLKEKLDFINSEKKKQAQFMKSEAISQIVTIFTISDE